MSSTNREERSRYFNTLSNIPMLDKGHLVDESFYKTTYGQEYVRKSRFAENKIEKIPDFSINNKYDFKELAEKLERKNGNKTQDEFKSESMNSLPNQKSPYYSDSRESLLDTSTETRAAFNGNLHIYKRPVIPSFIKRDHFYSTNTEKNLRFVHTDQGIFIPVVPDSPGRKGEKFNTSPDTPRKTMLDSFFLDKLSESQTSFTPKDQLTNRSKIMSHLRNDNTFHTNNSKNIRFVKTSNGGLINYVPDEDEHPILVGISNLERPITPAEQLPYNNNHLKIKLGNPDNQYRRNFSVLQNSFS